MVTYVTDSSEQKSAALTYVLAHELAHGVQEEAGLIQNQRPDSGYILRLEFQADCIAGATMQAIDPNRVALAARFVQGFRWDEQHGGGSERSQYFINGSNGSDCPF